MNPAARSNEVAHLEKMQAMVPKRTVSMLLDSKHGYAPLEREDRTAQGQLITRFRVEEWKYFSNAAIWLPAKCVVSHFTHPYRFDEFRETPVQTILINLKKVDFAPRKTEFVMISDPRYRVAGTEIHDETISNVVDGVRRGAILIMSANGTLLDQGVPLIRSPRSRPVMIGIMLLILAAPPFIYFFWQRRAPRQ
jgi:hypothetical protein